MAVLKTTSKYFGNDGNTEPSKQAAGQSSTASTNQYGISLSPTWTNQLVILENFSEAWWARRTNVATSIGIMHKEDRTSK